MQHNVYTSAEAQETTTPTSEPPRLTLQESQTLLDLLQRVDAQSLDALTDTEIETLHTLQERQQARATYDAQRLQQQRAEREAERQAGLAYDAAYRARLLQLDNAARQPLTPSQFNQQLATRYRPTPTITLPADLTTAQLYDYLARAYQHIVSQRTGHPARLDDSTKRCLTDTTRWLHQHPKPGLLLRGGVGVGKTTLLAAIQAVIQILTRQQLPVWDAQRIANLGKGADGQAVLNRLTTTPLLGIDDLGTEPLTVKDYGNDTLPIIHLLTTRYTHRLPTIITTNLTTIQRDSQTIDEIAERYGLRIADRLHELCNTITYNPAQPSYRQ